MGFNDLSPAMKKKLAAAKVSGSGTPLRDGSYVLEINDILVSQKYKGTFFTVETTIVESEKIIPEVEPNLPGTKASALHTNLDTNEMGPGNMKQAVCAICNLPEDVDEETYLKELARITDDKQPMRGALVLVETFRKTTQKGPNAGKVGTYPKFIHVEQSEAEIAARRKAQEEAA